MSRTTLCVLTAAGLASLSLGVGVLRYQVLGSETRAPAGPGTYKVTMLVCGKSTGDARLLTACPLDFNRQHVLREDYRSEELLPRPSELRTSERRQIQWLQRPGTRKGPFQARYEFLCNVDIHHPTSPMTKLTRALYAAPKSGEYTRSEPRIDPSAPDISELALHLAAGLDQPADVVRALFRYVDEEIGNEPSAGSPGLSAVDCLKAGRGDAAAKSRLLAALCRSRAIPARLVTGLTLRKRSQQTAHTWVEAWVGDHWMPLCPFNHYCGRVPPTYLVFGFGDMVMARGHNVRNLEYACLVEPRAAAEQAAPARSLAQRVFCALSLFALPPAEHRLVEFLLLLPIAALIICVYRNVIGINSFGTFAPALVGLAFRELESLPGILVFVSIVLVGWGMRRVLDRYHLLQVPRTAFLLSLVVIVLIVAVVAANFEDLPATRYFSLFPMVILTGMIERFWTLETEDGTAASFKTLLGTMLIAATISVALSVHAVVHHMVRYPETLGLIMAAQLLIGRYTGYRLSELFRFRDFVQPPPAPPGPRLLETP
jgi:hypothetical protein